MPVSAKHPAAQKSLKTLQAILYGSAIKRLGRWPVFLAVFPRQTGGGGLAEHSAGFHHPHSANPYSSQESSSVEHPKARRPRWHEMDRLDTKAVRPYVNSGESFTEWETEAGPLQLELVWQERSGGTFGPGSAAYANYLRRCIKKPIERSAVARIGNPNDRGRTSAWVLYFSCPTCSRRCRVLYSKKGRNEFGCVKCNRPAYPSNSWPYTGRRNAHSINRLGREMKRHQNRAEKIARCTKGAMKSYRFSSLERSRLLHEQYALLALLEMQLTCKNKARM
jgi:hypothetical protein